MTTKSAETKFYIGTSTPADTGAEYAADSYNEVKGLTEIESPSPTTTRGTAERLDTGTIEVFKGATDPGELTLRFIYIEDDTGQLAVEAAEASDSPVNFKIALSNEEELGFSALVMRSAIVPGGINEPVSFEVALASTSRRPVRLPDSE